MRQRFDFDAIDRETVLSVHGGVIQSQGGVAGVRDEEALMLASDQRMLVDFHIGSELDEFDVAACYAGEIVKRQPFHDKNEATALAVSACFLERHGYSLAQMPEEETTRVLNWVAAEKVGNGWLADLFRDHAVPIVRGQIGEAESIRQEVQREIRQNSLPVNSPEIGISIENEI